MVSRPCSVSDPEPKGPAEIELTLWGHHKRTLLTAPYHPPPRLMYGPENLREIRAVAITASSCTTILRLPLLALRLWHLTPHH
jgi:hypothetical protein